MSALVVNLVKQDLSSVKCHSPSIKDLNNLKIEQQLHNSQEIFEYLMKKDLRKLKSVTLSEIYYTDVSQFLNFLFSQGESLVSFQVRNCYFQEQIFAHFCSISCQLQVLNLNGSYFLSPQTLKAIISSCNPNNLKTLNLSLTQTNDSVLKELSVFQKLEAFIFEQNGNFTSQSLQHLPSSITELDFKYSQLDSQKFSKISHLKNIKKISVQDCYCISDQEVEGVILQNMTKMESLDLSTTLVSGKILPRLSSLPQLQKLKLMECNFMTSISIQNFFSSSSFKKLLQLDLSSSNIEDAALDVLLKVDSKLIELNLVQCHNLTPQGLSEMPGTKLFNQLDLLDISTTKVNSLFVKSCFEKATTHTIKQLTMCCCFDLTKEDKTQLKIVFQPSVLLIN